MRNYNSADLASLSRLRACIKMFTIHNINGQIGKWSNPTVSSAQLAQFTELSPFLRGMSSNLILVIFLPF